MLATRKCGDTRRFQAVGHNCEADGNQRMSGVDGKERRAVGDQSDTMDQGRSEICEQGEVVFNQYLLSTGSQSGVRMICGLM